MKQNGIVQSVFNLFFFFCLQILIFRNIVLFDLSFCFVYVAFILLIPIETPQMLTLLLAFVFGFCIDVFYDTIGIHMAACVLIAYARPYIMQSLTPRGGYDVTSEISIASMGIQWFLTYAGVMIFMHHFSLFIIEAWGFGSIWRMLGKTILSTMFTLFVVILFQYLLNPARKK